jgi:hypothetical protein
MLLSREVSDVTDSGLPIHRRMGKVSWLFECVRDKISECEKRSTGSSHGDHNRRLVLFLDLRFPPTFGTPFPPFQSRQSTKDLGRLPVSKQPYHCDLRFSRLEFLR